MVNSSSWCRALTPLPTVPGFESSFRDALAAEVKPLEAERKWIIPPPSGSLWLPEQPACHSVATRSWRTPAN